MTVTWKTVTWEPGTWETEKAGITYLLTSPLSVTI